MNVEIGTETPIFLFWEYLLQICGIFSLQFVPVFLLKLSPHPRSLLNEFLPDGHHSLISTLFKLLSESIPAFLTHEKTTFVAMIESIVDLPKFGNSMQLRHLFSCNIFPGIKVTDLVSKR
jgi:hypothetical protein